MNVSEQLKQKELEIFRDFLKICQAHNFSYFVAGGTALGTVRHKGFIPWDDDIDVLMPREDYNKFLRIAQEELPENIFVQTNETDPEYPITYAKLRDKNTTFLEKSAQHLSMNHGVFIDIFPLDGCYEKGLKYVAFKVKDTIWGWQISSAFHSPKPLNWKGKIFRSLFLICFRDYKKGCKNRIKYCKSFEYDDCNIVRNYSGAWGDKEMMPKAVFGNGCKGMFEGIEVVLPEKYDEYLTRLYGDYMQLPPEEKRVTHHYTDIIDIEHPYTDYIK